MIKMNCAFSSSDENFMLSIIYRVISIYTKMNLIVLEQTRNYAFFPKAKNIITKKKKYGSLNQKAGVNNISLEN